MIALYLVIKISHLVNRSLVSLDSIKKIKTGGLESLFLFIYLFSLFWGRTHGIWGSQARGLINAGSMLSL